MNHHRIPVAVRPIETLAQWLRGRLISNLMCQADAIPDPYWKRMHLDYAAYITNRQDGAATDRLPTEFVFDLDGTLIDTEMSVLKTWQYTLRRYHYTYSLDELRQVQGLPIAQTVERLGVYVDDHFEDQWTRDHALFSNEMDFFPGTRQMLAALRECGHNIGIVTSRSRKEYEAYFTEFQLETFVDRIVFADETTQHKPNPEPLLMYAELRKLQPSACVYIGDMPTDMECAHRAGAAAGLAAWNGSVTSRADADYLFFTPEDVLTLA